MNILTLKSELVKKMLDLKQITFYVDLRLKDWGDAQIRESINECRGAPNKSAFLVNRNLSSSSGSRMLISSQSEETGKILNEMRKDKVKNINLIFKRYTYDRVGDIESGKKPKDNVAFAREEGMSLQTYNTALRDLKILIGYKLIENGALKVSC